MRAHIFYWQIFTCMARGLAHQSWSPFQALLPLRFDNTGHDASVLCMGEGGANRRLFLQFLSPHGVTTSVQWCKRLLLYPRGGENTFSSSAEMIKPAGLTYVTRAVVQWQPRLICAQNLCYCKQLPCKCWALSRKWWLTPVGSGTLWN